MTKEFGSGLDGFLIPTPKISGILNGLDTCKWDPATDTELAARFTVKNLSDRIENKTFLQGELGLETDPRYSSACHDHPHRSRKVWTSL